MYVSPLKGVRPFARLNLSLSLSSLAFYPSLIHISTIYVHISLYYTSLVLMILKWRTTFTLFSFFSLLFLLARFLSLIPSLCLSLSRAHSYSRSFSLSNTGRVLSDKNSSLNKHMIQKLLSYRLTASVKRIVYFFYFFIIFFPLILVLSFSFSLPTLLSLSVPPFLSLFKYLKKLALENRNPRNRRLRPVKSQRNWTTIPW